MGLPAVGLDDDAVRGPVVVGLAVAVVGGVEGLVDERLGQSRVAQQRAGRRPPTRCGSTWARGSSRRARTFVPRCPLASGDDVFDRAVVVELQALGLGERALELAAAGGRRDVEQGAGDRRGRDALVAGGVLGIEGASAVQADPRGAVAAARRGDVDARLVGAEQAPVGGGAAMAEDRARPAGEHRREPAALDAQRCVPDRVHAAVEAVQPLRTQPVIARSVARARGRAAARRDTTPHCRAASSRHRDQGGGLSCRALSRFKEPTPSACAGNPLQRTPRTSPQLLTPRCPRRTAPQATADDPSAARSPAPRSSSAPARTGGPRRR